MGGALPAPARSLRARAIQLLAQREHSRVELRRKLLAHALAARATCHEADLAHREFCEEGAAQELLAELDALLDWLEAKRYLSAQRFIETRVQARAPRFGNLRIRQELAQHDVRLSEEHESTLKATELSRARTVWQRRYGAPPANPGERAAQSRFLAARGFSGDVIRRLLREESDRATANDPGAAETG